MIQAMVGKKLGMTQVFDESGVVYPATVIECGPNVVTQIKTEAKDGYEAVQLGFGLDSRLNRPEQGHRKASGFQSRDLREVKADSYDDLEVGQVFKADGIELHAIATPGHSPGSTCLYAPALGAVFSGDTLFQGGPGATGRSFSDFPTILGSIKDKLGKLPPDTVVYTGHGDNTRIGDEIVNYDEWVARGH